MGDRFELLEEKVDQVLILLEKYKEENKRLKEVNNNLQSELSEIKQDFDKYKLLHTDQSNRVKEKLNSVLNRIDDLEKIEF